MPRILTLSPTLLSLHAIKHEAGRIAGNSHLQAHLQHI